MRFLVRFLVLLFFIIITANAFSAVPTTSVVTKIEETGMLVIEVTGLRNMDGSVRIGIYDNQEDWLKKGLYEIRITANEKVVFKIPKLKYGEYSYLIFHDENDDTQYNMDWFPVPKPKEGVWISNGALPSMGPPSFKDANFSFRNSYRLEKVILKYY